MKDFVIFCLDIKKFHLNKIIAASRNQSSIEKVSDLEMNVSGHEGEEEEEEEKVKENRIESVVSYLSKRALDLVDTRKKAFDIYLSIDFFIESIFLAIIDSESKISSHSVFNKVFFLVLISKLLIQKKIL